MAWVATSEIQAAQVGNDVLREGGTAVDAAIATAAALTVTEPTSNGLGGDLFALVHEGEEVHALAANGASPKNLPAEWLRQSNEEMPTTGWPTVTVPGQVSGWSALHERFGRMPVSALLQPAIALARDGFVLGPVTAEAWARASVIYRDAPTWRHTFLNPGLPKVGERYRLPELATTLQLLALDGLPAFYTQVAQEIVRFAAETGGWFTVDDFTTHEPRWVTPLSVLYGDWRVFGMTAPTQGVCALEALGILEHPQDGGEAEVHRSIEAIKLAFADTVATMADPGHLGTGPVELLSDFVPLDPTRVDLGPSGSQPGFPGNRGRNGLGVRGRR